MLLKNVGEIADEYGITPRTLRFYEECGLLRPTRSGGNTRKYSGENERRLKVILKLAAAGLTISDISELAGIRKKNRSGSEASREVAANLEKIQADIESKMNLLKYLHKELGKTMDKISHCRTCRKKPSRNVCLHCDVFSDWENYDMLNLIVEEEDESDLQGKVG